MNQVISPTKKFYLSISEEVLRYREKLNNKIYSTSPNLSEEFITYSKQRFNENIESSYGEMLPYILLDLIDSKSNQEDITIGWQALYFYTILMDDLLDKDVEVSPQKMLLSSTLSQIAFSNIIPSSKDSKYYSIIQEALSDTIKYQLLDLGDKKVNRKRKIEYSKGKNRLAIAFAAVLASRNEKHGDFLLKFTENLLLAVQFIDDITDFDSDYSKNNSTYLLHDVFGDKKFKTKSELLLELVESGALLKTVEKICYYFSISICQLNEYRISRNNKTYIMFSELHYSLEGFKDYLLNFKNKQGTIGDEKILKTVEKYIKYIAQSS